jgi:hypothetical protein
VEWATTSSATSGVVARGPSLVVWRRPAASSAECSLRGEHGHREQGWRAGPGDRPGWSNGNRPLTCSPSPLNDFQIFKLH